MKSENRQLLTWTHFLVNSSLVSWNFTSSVQQFKWHLKNRWWWLNSKYWSLLRQRPFFSFTPQYTSFITFKYTSHFGTVTIISSTSGFGSSAFLLNFGNIVNYKKLNILVWKCEDVFSTAHTILRDWLRMLCLRTSDHVWIDISQVMTSQNEFSYTMFRLYDYYIVLIFLVEFYIILP